MTIEDAKIRLKRARSYLFAISRELNKIDELWGKIYSPASPRWSLEMPGTDRDVYKSALFDRLAEREKAAGELYDYVCLVERELRCLAKSFPDEAQVLDMHYIDRNSLKEISKKMHFSYDWTRRLCATGLKEFAKQDTKKPL